MGRPFVRVVGVFSTVLCLARGPFRSVKGQEWYQADEVAESYEDKRFSRGGRVIDRRERAAVLDALSPLEDRRTLEIACGTGRFTVMLADRGADIVGLDISDAMLAEAREKARGVGVMDHLEFMRGDAARLPFPDDHFDAVFAMRFFHLADTPASFLSEMCRVSRDRVFFDTFRRYSARSLYNWLLPMGSRLYSETEVERLLSGAGLRLERVSHDFRFPFGFYREVPGNLAEAVWKVDTAVGRTPLGPPLASVSYWDARVV
jgi:ubiquinone/menaquinone biosynthesis C-methylase UbiE